MSLQFKKFIKHTTSWSLVFLCFCNALISLNAGAVSRHDLEQKKHSNQLQIRRIKLIKQEIIQKENLVTYNILRNQKRLESSKSALVSQQHLMTNTRADLQTLEASLGEISKQQQELSYQVGKRLRSFYMGERLSFLSMLLDSGNISTFLDRFYYKQRIFSQDKKLYSAYEIKTSILREKQEELAQEKNQLASTINHIQTYQGELNDAVTVDKILVDKLKTSKRAYDMAEDQLERESYGIEQAIMRLTRRGGIVLGSTGRMIAPVIAAITSTFGYRYHPIFHTQRFHSGIDLGAHYGSAVHAADGGQVIQAGWQGGYGKCVIINHGTQGGRNIATLYGHLSGTAVGVGQHVSKGQVVGFVGSTGFSTGPHLHFEVRENGRPVNPLNYVH